MVINPTRYYRDLDFAQKETHPSDIQFLLRQYLKSLKENACTMMSNLKRIDESFSSTIKRAKIKSIHMTDWEKPNTRITLVLPDDGPIRGEYEVHYDRVSIQEYFNIDEVLLSKNQKDDAIDYSEYIEAVQGGREQLYRLINRSIGHHFGKTFTQDGVVLGGINPTNEIIRGTRPLALLLPSLEQVENGWKYVKNVKTIKDGAMMYQLMDISLRLVSNDHMIIEDGEVILKLRLRRPLATYEVIQKGGKHD